MSFSRRGPGWALFVWGCLGLTALSGFEPSRLAYPDFRSIQPLPELRRAATEAGLPLSRFDLADGRTAVGAGDEIVAVASLVEGKRERQWLIATTAAELSVEEKAKKRKPDVVFYTVTGLEIRFDRTPAALEFRVLGPFESGRKAIVEENKRRVLVNASYLGVGFDRGGEACLRIRENSRAQKDGPKFDYKVAEKPFSKEEVEAARPLAEKIGLSADRERAMAGMSFALEEFVRLIARTPGLASVLRSVIDVPWLSVLTQRKTKFQTHTLSRSITTLSPALASSLGLPEGELHALPFYVAINGTPALTCWLVATSPRPPLLTSAGIIGLAAQRPGGNDPHLMIRLFASRVASAVASPSQ